MNEEQWRNEYASLDSPDTPEPVKTVSVTPKPKKGIVSFWGWIILTLFIIGTAILVVVWLSQAAKRNASEKNSSGVKIQEVDTADISGSPSSINLDAADRVVINGQLQTNQGVVISATDQPGGAVLGQLYVDKSTKQLRYFDGNNYITISSQSTEACQKNATDCGFALQSSLTAAINQLGSDISSQVGQATSGTKVSSLQGQSGDLTLQGSGGLTISGSGSNISLSLPQNLTTTASPQFAGLTVTGTVNASTITSSGQITFFANGQSYILPTTGGMGQTICTTGITCTAGGGEAVTLAPNVAGATTAQQNASPTLSSIFINNTGGANLLRLQGNSSDTFVVAQDGSTTITGGNFVQNGTGTFSTGTGSVSLNGTVVSAVTFRNTANSANAFQIQNDASVGLFNINTSSLTATLGASNTTASTVVQSGSGGITLQPNAGNGGGITLQGGANTGAAGGSVSINAGIGTSSTNGNISIGNNPYAALTLGTGTGSSVTIGNNSTPVTINCSNCSLGATSTGSLNLGSNTNAGNTIQSGANGTIITADSASALKIQNTLADYVLFKADTTTRTVTVQSQILVLSALANAPVINSAVNGGPSGGSLLSSIPAYYYKITALNNIGETIASNEITFNTSNFTTLDPPASAPTFSHFIGTNGLIGVGTYYYTMTYFNSANGTETAAGPRLGPISNTGANQIVINLPAAIASASVTHCRLYRTNASGGGAGTEKFVSGSAGDYGEVPYPCNGSFQDNTSNANLGATVPATGNLLTNSNKITLNYTGVSGATSYRIYRGTASGAENSYQTTASSTTFTDSGSAGTSGAPPIYPTDAKIGIGTNNPNSNFQVVGTATIGNIGVPSGQFYVSGEVPTGETSSIATGVSPRGITVQGNYAYVGNSGASNFMIFDVTNKSSPTLLSTVTTASTVNGLIIKGRYAYVLTAANTMQIFDVSNPSSVGAALGSIATKTTTQAITIQGRYAYVTNSGSASLEIFDISSPAAPVKQSELSLGGSNLRSIAVQDGYAYIANGGSNAFQVVSIANPSNPTLSSSLSLGGTSNPYAVALQGRYAYVTYSGTAASLARIDIANPASPVVSTSTAAGGSPRFVVVQGRYAYVTLTSGGLVSYNISGTTLGINGTVGAGSGSLNLSAAGRYVYVVNASAATMQIFNMGGTYSQQLEAGSIETGNLQVNSNLDVVGAANLAGGLNLNGGLQATGDSSFYGNFSIQNTANSSNIFSASSVTNLATNSSFEAGTTSWSAKGSSTISQSSAQFYDGTKSLSVATTTAASDGARYVYAFSPGGTYTLTFKGRVASGSITDVAIGRQDNGSTDTNCLSSQTFNTTWTQFSCTFTVGTTIASSNFYVKKTGVAAETFFIDAVQLVSGSSSHAFSSSTTYGVINLNGIVANPMTFRNTSNSTSAFQIQDASGKSLFLADTTNSRIGINNSAPSADLSFGEGADRTIDVQTRTTNVAGNNLTVKAGDGGAGGGAVQGGNLILQAGSAGGTGNAAGGDVIVKTGTGVGSGDSGNFSIQDGGSNPFFRAQTTGGVGAGAAVTCGLFLTNTCTYTAGLVGTGTNSNNVSIVTQNTNDASTTGTISIATGNSTGNSGNLSIDVGTASGTTGTISIGTVNAVSITIGKSTSTVTINGSTIVVGLLTVNSHIISGNVSGTTQIASNANCGTGCTVGISGNDTSGVITVNTGTTAAAGIQATVTFANAYGSAPRIIITPATVPAASTFPPYYVTSAAATFDLLMYASLTDSKTYTFNYFIVQ